MIGEYVDNLDSKHLNISVYSGEVDLKDLVLKRTITEKIDLPIKLVLGRMKRLYIKVPWNALSSKPV